VKASFRILLMVALVTLMGCGREPERVEVQHLLVSFEGSIPKDTVTRTQAEAEALANELLEIARSGADFDSLVQKYTDDSHPGIYAMRNFEVEPLEGIREYARDGMVQGFGDVRFSLKVCKFGMAVFDSTASRYGWHIIKRLK